MSAEVKSLNVGAGGGGEVQVNLGGGGGGGGGSGGGGGGGDGGGGGGELPTTTMSAAASKSKLWKDSIRIGSVIGFYISVSISLVFVNKWMLSYLATPFAFPLFVTLYQLLVSFVCIVALGAAGTRYRSLSFVPPFHIDVRVAREVAPLTCVYVGMLATNNLCLKYVEVSYFQIARSLAVVWQIVLSYVVLGDSTTPAAAAACGIVVVGFVVGTEGELTFSWAGVVFGVLSSLFVALHGIFVKRTIKSVGSEWTLAMYNTTMAMPAMALLVFVSGEWQGVLEFDEADSSYFWSVMTLGGVLGFLINIAVFMQIKVTTPLTSVIVGASKSCLQTLLAVAIFQNPISPMNACGLVLTIVGTVCYSYVRFLNMSRKANV